MQVPVVSGTQLQDLPDGVKEILFYSVVGIPPARSPFTLLSLLNVCRDWRGLILNQVAHWDREHLGFYVQTSSILLKLAPAIKTLELCNVRFSQDAGAEVSALLQKHAASLEELKVSLVAVEEKAYLPLLKDLSLLTKLSVLTTHPTTTLFSSLPPNLVQLFSTCDQYNQRPFPNRAKFSPWSKDEINSTAQIKAVVWGISECSGVAYPSDEAKADAARCCFLRDLEVRDVDELTAKGDAGLEFLALKGWNLSKWSGDRLGSLGPHLRFLRAFNITFMMNNGITMHYASIMKGLASFGEMPFLEYIDTPDIAIADLAPIFLNPTYFPRLLLIRPSWERNETVENQEFKFTLDRPVVGVKSKSVTIKFHVPSTLWRDDGSFQYVLINHPLYRQLITIRFNHRFGGNEKEVW